MKRQRRKATKKDQARAGSKPPATQRKKTLNRRDLMQNIAYGALGIGILGGGGWYFVSGVRADMLERDLSRIGNGIPTVVQIHDPQCPHCQALQREAREAISRFDDGTIQFLVANIRLAEGRELAAAHGVGHVTLLLFDGEGRRRDVLVGRNRSEVLEGEFRRLIQTSTPTG